jgi:PiT family inorganic phosphate transporter
MVRYRRAVAIAAVMVIVGAVAGGSPGIVRLGGLTQQTAWTAAVVTSVAAATVIAMTVPGLPVSTSQAVAGAIIGMGLWTNPASVRWDSLGTMVACWVGTPIGAAAIAAAIYHVLGGCLDRLKLNLVWRSVLLQAGLVVAGAYGAFALGANNVANVTGAFYGTTAIGKGYGAEYGLALVGGAAIAVGVVAFGRNVMFTVGRDLAKLGAFSALAAVLAEAVTVHVYSILGVPVSTSQAIVGAVLGIGLVRGAGTVNRRVLAKILLAWLATPAIAGALAYAAAAIFF